MIPETMILETTRTARILAVFALLVMATWTGCSDATVAPRETWNATYLRGVRVGYSRTTVSHISHSGRKAVKTEGLQHMIVRRGGQPTEQDLRITSIETPDGKLLEFQSEIGPGATPLRTTGRVVGGRLELETASQGRKESTSIPWSAEYGGPYAMLQTLRREPMEPGQRRIIQALAPVFNVVATHEMTAKDYESVDLPTDSENLLRIDCVTRFPDGKTLPMVIWADRTGEIVKTRTEAMEIEEFRVTKALALEEADVGRVDLVTDLAVRVGRALPRAHQTKRIRYRIQLEGGDPAEVFVSGASQEIKPIDSNTAELTVYALRPGGTPNTPDDRPTDADRLPNNFIQSDDAKIVAMAREAVGNEKDPWRSALALEQYVNRRMTEVDFSRAFVTAAEVAENPVGDCTEHAVLLAALARACGTPARVAIGLVYMEGKQSLGYHMWTEVYVQRRWIGLDATLGRGGVGAAHLKLAHSNLHGASAYSSFLPIVQVVGRLKIEILEVE